MVVVWQPFCNLEERTKRVTEAWVQSPSVVEPLKQMLIIKHDTYVHKLCKSLMPSYCLSCC